MVSEAQKRAKIKYEKQARRLNITIYPSEKDLMSKIEEESKKDGYAPYIKRLIRKDIAESK